MKLIVLVDGDPGNPKRMMNVAKTNKPITLSFTGKCDEVAEFNKIYEAIETFSQSDGDIMIIGTSGREDVIDNLSSERPEMIIPLSSKKTSKYYVEKPINMFLDLIKIFENVAEPV